LETIREKAALLSRAVHVRNGVGERTTLGDDLPIQIYGVERRLVSGEELNLPQLRVGGVK